MAAMPEEQVRDMCLVPRRCTALCCEKRDVLHLRSPLYYPGHLMSIMATENK